MACTSAEDKRGGVCLPFAFMHSFEKGDSNRCRNAYERILHARLTPAILGAHKKSKVSCLTGPSEALDGSSSLICVAVRGLACKAAHLARTSLCMTPSRALLCVECSTYPSAAADILP